MENSKYKEYNHFYGAMVDSATDETQDAEWLKYSDRLTPLRADGDWIQPNPLCFNKRTPCQVFPDGTNIAVPDGLNVWVDVNNCVSYEGLPEKKD